MFGKLFHRIKHGSQDKKRYDYIQDLFSNPNTWIEYETARGTVRGFTSRDLFYKVEKEIPYSNQIEVLDVLRDLSTRQIISGVYHTTLDGNSIYRPLLWG